MPLYPVETVRRVELEPSSVTKIPVTVKGDPKGCWILEPGFPDCRFFMPSAVMGPSKEGYVWVINDAKDKMYMPEGTIMGIGQDWEEEEGEEQEIEEYSEPSVLMLWQDVNTFLVWIWLMGITRSRWRGKTGIKRHL